MFRCVIQGDPVSVSSNMIVLMLLLLLLLLVVAVSQPSVLVTVVKSIVVLFHGWGWVRWRMWCTVIATNDGSCLIIDMVAVIMLAVVVIARCDSVVDVDVVKMLQLLVLVLVLLVVGRRN